MSLGQVESRKKPYVTYVKTHTHTHLYFEVWIEKTQTLSRTQHVWLNVHINIYGLYISKIEILQGQPQSNWKGSGSTVWSAWQWSIKTSQVETCNLNLFCFSDTSSHAKTIFQISEWVSERLIECERSKHLFHHPCQAQKNCHGWDSFFKVKVTWSWTGTFKGVAPASKIKVSSLSTLRRFWYASRSASALALRFGGEEAVSGGGSSLKYCHILVSTTCSCFKATVIVACNSDIAARSSILASPESMITRKDKCRFVIEPRELQWHDKHLHAASSRISSKHAECLKHDSSVLREVNDMRLQVDGGNTIHHQTKTIKHTHKKMFFFRC